MGWVERVRMTGQLVVRYLVDLEVSEPTAGSAMG